MCSYPIQEEKTKWQTLIVQNCSLGGTSFGVKITRWGRGRRGRRRRRRRRVCKEGGDQLWVGTGEDISQPSTLADQNLKEERIVIFKSLSANLSFVIIGQICTFFVSKYLLIVMFFTLLYFFSQRRRKIKSNEHLFQSNVKTPERIVWNTKSGWFNLVLEEDNNTLLTYVFKHNTKSGSNFEGEKHAHHLCVYLLLYLYQFVFSVW